MNAPAQERETLWFSSVMSPIAADLDVQEAGRLAMGLGISGPAGETRHRRCYYRIEQQVDAHSHAPSNQCTLSTRRSPLIR
jgi:hypothetical protein